MSRELAANIRLVRCPKCKELLPEPQDSILYNCGGCGTTLQAKKRRSEAANPKPSSHGTEVAPRNAVNLVSEDKEQSNPAQKAVSSSSGECSLGENSRKNEDSMECNGEMEDERNFNASSDIRIKDHEDSEKGNSTELDHCETKASSALMRENSVEEEKIQKNAILAGAKEVDNGNLLSAAPQDQNCVLDRQDDKKSCSTELAHSETDASSLVTGAEDLNGALNGDDMKSCSTEMIHVESEASPALMGENSVAEADANSLLTGAKESNDGNLLSAGQELNFASDEDANKEQLDEVEAKSRLDYRNDSTSKTSSTESFESAKRSISNITALNIADSTISGNLVASPGEQQKQTQNGFHHSFDRPSSVDTVDTTEIANHLSSDLSSAFEEMHKSSSIRSYHAYDGSVSSFDGMDEGFTNQPSNPFENPYIAGNVISERRPRREEVLVNNMKYRDLETPEHSMDFSSDLPNRKSHFMRNSNRKQSEALETAGHSRPVRTSMRTDIDEYSSGMPFHHSGSQSSYETGSPSSRMHDESYYCSSFLSPEAFEDPDQEKIKLLKMIYKLQDQLNRTSFLNGEANGRISRGVSYTPTHHSHDLREGRFFDGLDYSTCNGRCRHGFNRHQRQTFSRIPFSAEATSSTHHAGHSCFYCCRQERQFSAELPPHVLCQHEELCRFLPDHNCYISRAHSSCPASPACFTDSKPPLYGHVRKYDDQRHRAPEVKQYLREKQTVVKRHFRPVAGGAPFVTCHNCCKLLQLPADFLLFKRVCHQLKCGACSKVLKFSLQNRSHIVSYAPSAVIGPTPSELNDQLEVLHGNNLPSETQANHYHNPHVDTVSYSDDYGPSVCRSCSSEDHGTFDPMAEKEKISSRHSSASKSPMGTYESSNVCGSEKLSMETEGPRASKSSPLYQLMDYSSPSQVIRGKDSSGAAASSLSVEKI